MRVESIHPVKNGGWMHFFEECQIKPAPITQFRKQLKIQKVDYEAMLRRWKSPDMVRLLAEDLGVARTALESLGACWADPYKAFAFPMRNPACETIGIRLRNDMRKWAVLGSRAGLFIPELSELSVKQILICEGPTDTAAGLSLGFYSIGRPSCLGCEEMVSEVLQELGTSEAIICYDADAPGIRGAERLASVLKCSVVKFVPPTKDLRSFLQAGASKDLVLSMINDSLRTRR